jgi:predicted acylesterase/phospholipase RssA
VTEVHPAPPRVRTRLFRNCLGVFQGGGCRGAALAGAYDGAAECGVHFSKVAGTSAGSIMAALVGAGASPSYIIEKLTSLDIVKRLQKAKRIAITQPWRVRVLADALGAIGYPDLRRLLRRGGIYSSRWIFNWMDGMLAELLPHAARPVTFKSLPKPTFIVAADLLSSSAKVWSSEHTPGDSVAAAVQASCAIPGFLQPIEAEATRYVDGGILSNLPTFVFYNDRVPDAGLQEPILAFQLKSDYSAVGDWDVIEMGRRVAGVVVDGAVEIQSRLQRNVHLVTIKTGGILATDFQKLNEDTIKDLAKVGREAAIEFVRSETNHPPDREESRYFYHEEEVFRTLVQYGQIPLREASACLPTTRWVWSLFPLLLAWRRAGVSVRVIAQPISGGDVERRQEAQRRTLLRDLGVQFSEQDLRINGFVLRGALPQEHSAIIYTPDAIGERPMATFYSGLLNSAVIDLAQAAMAQSDIVDETRGLPTLRRYQGDFPAHLKRSIFHYDSNEVTVVIEKVPLSAMRILTPKIREYKLRQLDLLVRAFNEQECELFEPLEVVFDNGKTSIVTPPVVELIDGVYNVIEGNTRCFFCFQNDSTEMTCAVVRNVKAELPRQPFDLTHAIITAHEKNTPLRDRQLFRPIEERMHPY